MTKEPVSIHPDMMLVDAEAMMLARKIKALIVTNKENNMVGILEIYDR